MVHKLKHKNVIAGILAGGKSRRYGKNKALVKYKNKSLIDWVIDNTKTFTNNIYIITKNTEEYKHLSRPVIEDAFSEPTPISGILTIAPLVKNWLLLLACDMPFFNNNILNMLWEEKEEGKATLFRLNNKLQPFLALYPSETLKYWETAFYNQERRLRKILLNIPMKIIEENKIKKIDSDFLAFTNINKPENLIKFE